MNQIAIKIIYDNRKENPKMQKGWGFSCMIEINKRKILFDTGADQTAFFANLQHLGINLEDVTDIVFSHKHSDHIAGWQDILNLMKKSIRLFLPKSFPTPQLSSLVEVTYVSNLAQLDTHVYSIVLRGGFRLYEQALVLRANRGLVVITGCAHPGITHLVKTIKEHFNEPIHLVLGGFHLFRQSRRVVKKIVDQFKTLQIENAAPCHCSGDETIEEFKNAYQDHFYKIGSGTIITLNN